MPPSALLAATVVSRAGLLGVGAPGQLDAPHAASSPGPIYLPKKLGATGPQVLSSVATQPRIVIGTAPRFLRPVAANVPGPGAYPSAPPQRGPSYSMRAREAFGSQESSGARGVPGPGAHSRLETAQTRRKNAPAFTLRPRPAPSLAAEATPAPGHSQHVPDAAAPQVLSTKPSLASTRFGRAGRDAGARSSTGSEIGPGSYADGDVTLLTGHRKGPAFSMGVRTVPRRRTVEDAPVRVLPPALGRQVVSTSTSAPSFSMGARTRFAGYPNLETY